MMKSDYITLPNEGETFDIVQVSSSRRVQANLAVAREFPVTIILNGQELVTLLASFVAGCAQKTTPTPEVITVEKTVVTTVEVVNEASSPPHQHQPLKVVKP
jgi:hypothetical protein